MNWQTRQPLEREPRESFNTPVEQILSQIRSGELDLSPPYQRGDEWPEDLQVGIWMSHLSDGTIPALLINQRTWATGGEPRYAVLDGKQRLNAILAWFDGRLTLPASWFTEAMVADRSRREDGWWVTFGQLTELGQSFTSRGTLPIRQVQLPSLKAEAEKYLLVNRSGIAHTEADFERARQVADGR
jgi:hypothetical protein